ncbi:MAG: helix-turn-helix domain-containing protein, partial [Candidatus Aminicenantaceae bacterium]
IPLLVNNILRKEEKGIKIMKEISEGALEKLMEYNFPGNVRELENIIEGACILTEGNLITEKDIKFDSELSTNKKSYKITPEQLRKILENCRWNKTRAANKIGKSRRQFYRLLEKYQMIDCIRKNFSM